MSRNEVLHPDNYKLPGDNWHVSTINPAIAEMANHVDRFEVERVLNSFHTHPDILIFCWK
jgi:hypothetical protein